MIVGRKKEIEILNNALNDNISHFIAMYGRRRVGKTFLIKETFSGRFTFSHAGLFNGKLSEQLYAFNDSLKNHGLDNKKVPKSWLEAFSLLKDLINLSKEKKKIIFIDELSWMDNNKANFIGGLENFYNSFVSLRDDIVLIVCGSSTSWMLNKVIHNKGGLYNRLTEQINLKPFTLKECEEYVYENNLSMSKLEILNAYMIFGGVPFYWKKLDRRYSLSQNIDYLFFNKQGLLKDEYKYLYASIFKKPEGYIKIIETLSKKKSGLTREEIVDIGNINNSGDLSIKLEELEACGFIQSYIPYGNKKKGTVYQLVDFFTIFYFEFLKNKPSDENYWSNQLNNPKINTWLGYSFERVCFMHTNQIKQALGISGIQTSFNSFRNNENKQLGINGCQIDMLIVRKDNVINICEMKYCNTLYSIDKEFNESINNKINSFNIITNNKKYSIKPILITTYGLNDNEYRNSITNLVTLQDLFK